MGDRMMTVCLKTDLNHFLALHVVRHQAKSLRRVYTGHRADRDSVPRKTRIRITRPALYCSQLKSKLYS